MADYFCDESKTGGLNSGSDWTNAFLDIKTACDTVTSDKANNFYVAHNHNKDYALGITFGTNGSFYSCTQDITPVEYQAGASESADTSGSDLSFLSTNGFTSFDGVSIGAADIIKLCIGTGQVVKFSNSKIFVSGAFAGETFSFKVDGTRTIFDNIELNFLNIGQYVYVGGGSRLELNGCFSTGVPVTKLFSVGAGNGGASIALNNTDLTGLISTSGYLLTGLALTSSDNVKIKLYKCKLPNWISWTDSVSYAFFGWEVDMKSCTNPATQDDDTYYYYEYHNAFGDVFCDASNYLTTLDNGLHYSTLFSSSSLTKPGSPLRYKIAEIPAAKLTADTTYKINFTSDTALTDTEFWLDIVYPDNNALALGVRDDNRNAAILSAGTAHTTNVESWTGGGTVKMQDEILITGMANVSDGNVEIWGNLSLPLTEVWSDIQPVVS